MSHTPDTYTDGWFKVKQQELAAKLPALPSLTSREPFYSVELLPDVPNHQYYLGTTVGNYCDEETAKEYARLYFKATQGTTPSIRVQPVARCLVFRNDGRPMARREVVYQLPIAP